MTSTLIRERHYTTTHALGLVEASTKEVVGAARQRFGTIAKTWELRLGVRELTEDLGEALSLLEEKHPYPTRFLYLPTQEGHWTVYFDNRAAGTDPDLGGTILAKTLGCTALRVVATDQGARVLEVHQGPRLQRSIYLAKSNGRWDFEVHGDPLPFEEVEYYTKRRKAARFPPELFERYLAALDVRPYENEWYAPGGFLLEMKPRGKGPSRQAIARMFGGRLV